MLEHAGSNLVQIDIRASFNRRGLLAAGNKRLKYELAVDSHRYGTCLCPVSNSDAREVSGSIWYFLG